MAAVASEEEFLNRWFPDLYSKSYIIPVTHLDHIHADLTDIGDVPIGVLRPKDDCSIPEAHEIKQRDDIHKTVHFLFTKLKDHTAKEEVMVMMTQASSSMYRSIVSATRHASLEDIIKQKHKHSDLVIVNKQRDVLVGVVQSVNAADPRLARQKLEESVTYLTEAARIVQEVVRTVHRADNVAVRTTLVLSNITRAQLEEKQFQLQKAVQEVPCLCKDEMVTDECLERWWEDCWSSRHLDFIDSDMYRDLVARFAIPATRVEIYLTTQPRLQLKHEHDVVNAVGDIHGAEVFQAGLHQLSLFPTQAGLLDFDYLDDSVDDVKFLWGPPGTGKTILLVLRAFQWVKHFSARHIVILQTSYDGTAASCLVEYQLQQTLNAQQQRARQSGTDKQSAQCTFTHVDISGSVKWKVGTTKREVELEEGWQEKLYTALGLQQRGQIDTGIHIIADEANSHVVAAVYQWLKEKDVRTVRLWAAGVVAFWDKKNIPALLQHAVCHVTEPLRCPGPVVREVMKASKIKEGLVPRYDIGLQLTDGPPIVELQHYQGRDGHSEIYAWRCGQCAKNIGSRLRLLHVGESDQGLSANDVFIVGCDMDCDVSDDNDRSPAPLINALRDNGYNVRTLSSTSARDEIMAVAKRDVTPPAVTVANEKCVWGLERKIVIYCDSGLDTKYKGRLRAFSRSTALLICIKTSKFASQRLVKPQLDGSEQNNETWQSALHIEKHRMKEWKTRHDDDETDGWTALHLACYYREWNKNISSLIKLHNMSLIPPSVKTDDKGDVDAVDQKQREVDHNNITKASSPEDPKESISSKASEHNNSPAQEDSKPGAPEAEKSTTKAGKRKVIQYVYPPVYINLQTEDGDTPLHIACSRDNTKAVKSLLHHKADVTTVNNRGKTAEDIARDCNNSSIHEMLTFVSQAQTYEENE